MKTTLTLILSMCTLALAQADEKPAQGNPVMPPGMTGKHETFTAKIKKVYRTESDSGAVFQAFVVEWKDSEVVVQDMFGRSKKKVGDTITVMVHEIDMPDEDKRIKVLQFMSMDSFTGL